MYKTEYHLNQSFAIHWYIIKSSGNWRRKLMRQTSEVQFYDIVWKDTIEVIFGDAIRQSSLFQDL